MDIDERLRPYIKVFPRTEVKPYGEPVEPGEMKVGRVYFALHYLDEAGLVPTIQPLIFIGYDDENPKLRVFQDYESFRAGVRYNSPEGTSDWPYAFEEYGPEGGKHIYDYEHALQILMFCALQRREIANVDDKVLDTAEPLK
jgi:hypothetical protein